MPLFPNLRIPCCREFCLGNIVFECAEGTVCTGMVNGEGVVVSSRQHAQPKRRRRTRHSAPRHARCTGTGMVAGAVCPWAHSDPLAPLIHACGRIASSFLSPPARTRAMHAHPWRCRRRACRPVPLHHGQLCTRPLPRRV